MQFVIKQCLWQKVHEDPVGDPIAVQTETVSLGIRSSFVRDHHSVISSSGICNSRSERFGQKTSIGSCESTFAIYVKLGIGNFLAE